MGGGKIVNISSIVGLVPVRNICSFAAAKAGGVYHGLDNTEGECDLEIYALSSCIPVLGSGHSEVYEQRVAAWGKSFVLEDE